MWHMQINQVMSAFMLGHQNWSVMCNFVAKINFVTDIVVCSMHDVKTTFGGDDNVVSAMQISLPKFARV